MPKTKSLYPFHVLVVLILMFLFRYVPPPEGLTPLSMQVIGIFAGTIYGWVTISMGWPSMLGLFALGLSDYMPMQQLFLNAFGSQIIIFFIVTLWIVAYMQQSGASELVLDYMLGRPEIQGRPFLLLFYFLFAGFIASLISNSFAALLIFLEFFREMSRRTGIKPFSPAVTCFFVGLALVLPFGDLALPIRGAAIMSMATYASLTGQAFDMMRFTIFMFPLCCACIAVYVLGCKYLFRIDLGMLKAYRHPTTMETVPIMKKAALIGASAYLILLLVPSLIPTEWSLGKFFNDIGLGGLALILAVPLLLIRIDGEPLMELRKITPYYSWEALLTTIFLITTATALTSEALGIRQYMAEIGAAILEGMPTLIFIFMAALIPGIFTNFLNNLVVAIVFMSIVCTIGPSLGLNLMALGCLVVLAAFNGTFFPAANPIHAYLFGQTDLVTFRQEFSHGIKTFLLITVFIAVAGYLWGMVCF